jgi:methylthioribose-1-phosphate isomerase
MQNIQGNHFMLFDGAPYRSIWFDDKNGQINIIDQRKLPHDFTIVSLSNLKNTVLAIQDMYVRGAPLIGVTAAFGFALAMREDPSDKGIDNAYSSLVAARPTAVNLEWACRLVATNLRTFSEGNRVEAAHNLAKKMADEDVETNTRIGKFGVDIIREISDRKTDGSPVRILTHCNAGWLATVDRGTATAPIYEAAEQGIDVEVWVDETRPRNQGASLTAWELHHNNIRNTLIVDNAGGHLMQKGVVDLVIVGSDRTTATGDVCNKIGTYLKALAAWDNNIPFYAAMPVSTIDFSINDSLLIPIEERAEEEVLKMTGTTASGKIETIKITIDGIKAANPAFDVTPAKYITGIITDNGILEPNRNSIMSIKP